MTKTQNSLFFNGVALAVVLATFQSCSPPAPAFSSEIDKIELEYNKKTDDDNNKNDNSSDEDINGTSGGIIISHPARKAKSIREIYGR